MKNKARNSNLDIMRIIAIFMVTMHHIAIQNWNITVNTLFSYNCEGFYGAFTYMNGKVGAGIFLMLSGFFVSKNFLPSKLKSLNKEILLVSLFYLLLAITIGDLSIFNSYNQIFASFQNNFFVGLGEWFAVAPHRIVIYSFVPMAVEASWFMFLYFALRLSSPFFLKWFNFEKKGEKRFNVFLLTLVTLTIIVPSFVGSSALASGLQLFAGATYFYTGFFIRRNIERFKKFKHCYFLLYIGVQILMLFMLTGFGINLNELNGYQKGLLTTSTCLASLTTYISGVTLFALFASLKPVYNKAITYLSSGVLGAFLYTDSGPISYRMIHIINYHQVSIYYVPLIAIGVTILFTMTHILLVKNKKLIFIDAFVDPIYDWLDSKYNAYYLKHNK